MRACGIFRIGHGGNLSSSLLRVIGDVSVAILVVFDCGGERLSVSATRTDACEWEHVSRGQLFSERTRT
jgi:hypothetical protein